ncbi:MAG: hypothetical protein JWR51_1592 [Devosia sp.]|uniref:hypothetical protein n=1 Tax=Devosia sp. TaxID=1871048 RepID=UPI002613AEA1|nr:hypothetical protein [Devosia sp.]MDB5528489.1 hypothetical protein [Devosia sp.]
MMGEGRTGQLADVLTPVFALGCLFANFTLAYPGGYPLNGSFFALAASAMLTLVIVGRVPQSPLLATAIVVAIVAIKAIGTEDVVESAKSGVQIIAAALCLCVFSVRRGNLVHREGFSVLFGRLMTLHAVLLIAQCIALNVFGSFALQNPFGPFSAIGPVGELDTLPGPYLPYEDGVMRPNGLYSEPSVAAAYTVFALACVLSATTLRSGQKVVMSVVLAAGAFATFALTGWAMLGGVLVCFMLFGAGSMKSSHRLGLYALALLAMVAAAIVGGSYLMDRLQGADEIGGSIYIRFTGPFMLIGEVLGNGLLGLPINDPTFLLTRNYLVDFAGRQFSTLDNFYVWLIVYFGLAGLGFFLWCLLQLWGALRKKGNLALPLVAMALFAAATGAGYNGVFILPLAVALSIVRSGQARALAEQTASGAAIPISLAAQ